jgi:hypothetical protein
MKVLGDRPVFPLALELGVNPKMEESFLSLVEENFVWNNPGALSEKEEYMVRERFLRTFVPYRRDTEWWDSAYTQFVSSLSSMADGLLSV